MKPEAQRIAIAEVCGWTIVEQDVGTHPDYPFSQVIPDYLNDLNAMHEAVRCLSIELRTRYITTLFGITNITGPYWDAVHATAAQRAEAFLRTIGKWEEPTP